MALKFYASVARRFKLKVRKFWGLIPMLEGVAAENLVGGPDIMDIFDLS